MKRFYSLKRQKKFIVLNKFGLIIMIVLLFDIVLFRFFLYRLSNNITYSAKVKIEELTKYYLNNTLKTFLNVDTTNYIKLNIVNNNIVNVDINNIECNKLLSNIIKDLEKNIYVIEKGEIKEYHNLEMLRSNDGVVVFMPFGVVLNNSIFSRLGPKVPVKVSFLENLTAYVDVEVESYGINNSLIKLYININIEEIIELPIKKDRNNIQYKFLLASKLINGEVPNMLGGYLNSNSSIVNSNVKN